MGRIGPKKHHKKRKHKMSLKTLLAFVSDKQNFPNLDAYIEFCRRYLDFIASDGLQAVIVSQNERHYRFFQYKKDGQFNITRPINETLMYNADNSRKIVSEFLHVLKNAQDIAEDDNEKRNVICNSIYTIQQTIGIALDALPAGKSNTAR